MAVHNLNSETDQPVQSRAGCAWHSIETAPYDLELELAVIDEEGPHALVFPCRRIAIGWADATTETWISIRPTHWREWRRLTRG